MLEQFTYRDGDITLNGLLARPVGTPRAAIAVFPTIMNSTPAVESKAAALAAAGYLVLVSDFYGSAAPDFQAAVQMAEALRSDVDAYRQRLLAAVSAMRGVPEAAGLPTLAIGFCLGGQAVLELARINAPVLAVASFHGLLETARKADQPIRPRILICHGDADVLVPRSHVMAFWEEMDAAAANWHFHSYSGVPHGFTNPNPSPVNGTISYDASADRQSWDAMLGLFDEILT